MLQKNIDRQSRKNRPTWNGFYTRKTPTKTELERRRLRKHKSTSSEY